jgi:hypothetical protein
MPDATLALGDLRSLVLTPDVRRPRVYCCRGCGLGFRAGESHDFTRCAAISRIVRDTGICGKTREDAGICGNIREDAGNAASCPDRGGAF